MELNKDDFVACHRVGKSRKQVICRLKSRDKKEEIMGNKKMEPKYLGKGAAFLTVSHLVTLLASYHHPFCNQEKGCSLYLKFDADELARYTT